MRRPALSYSKAPMSQVPAPAVIEQAPLLESQVAVWQASGATQGTGFAPMQTPASQRSRRVQALPSVHAAPSAFGIGALQLPEYMSHVPGVWHWSAAEHTTGFVPTHVPARQVSVCVHALESVQAAPSGWA